MTTTERQYIEKLKEELYKLRQWLIDEHKIIIGTYFIDEYLKHITNG
jgi:hypothetical protein